MKLDSTPSPTSVRLRPGYHLYAKDEVAWFLYTPDGRFIRINTPSEQVASIAAFFNGVLEYENISAQPALLHLLHQFEQRGFLEDSRLDRQAALSGRTVGVLGNNPVAEQVLQLLRQSNVGEVAHMEEHADFVVVDAIIACAGWLPDAQWVMLNAWCHKHNVVWHRCYAEGRKFYTGPLTIPGQTVSYADERARRLGAADFYQELAAYWSYLDKKEGVPSVPWPDAGAIAILAGLLVSQVLAFLRGDRSTAGSYQLALDPSTLLLERHPILPVPLGAMQEALP